MAVGAATVAAVVAAGVLVAVPAASAATGGKATITVKGPTGVALKIQLRGPAQVDRTVTIPSGSTSATVVQALGKDGTYKVTGVKAYATVPATRTSPSPGTALWTAKALPTSISVAGGSTAKVTVTYAVFVPRNMVVNPGAEGTPASQIRLPQWVVTAGDPTVATYADATAGGLSPTSPGPTSAARGANYWYGGKANSSILTQTLPLSATWQAAIATGQTGYSVSAWIGGKGAVDDKVEVRLRFRDATGKVVKEVLLGGVTNTVRRNTTRLMLRSAAGVVPKTPVAKKAEIELRFIPSSSDGVIDGYVDVVSFGLVA